MKVFYTPAREGRAPQVIDGLRVNEQGQEVGQFSRETLEQLAQRYPGVMVGDCDDVIRQQEAMLRTDPEAITEDRFNDALCILPPEGWVQNPGGASFKMCEYLSGRMTRIYACVAGTYWTFVDAADLSHADIMDKIFNHHRKTERTV